MALKLMYITNNLDVAIIAEKNGVDRIWIDLETLGKEERQKNMNSVKSHHSINDVERIASCLKTSEILVRVNPWNPDSENEINSVISAGAKVIMLPMWKTEDEVRAYIETVSGRCKTSILLETKEAEECLDEVLKIPGIDEIHIGLNDLHLSYGLTFMFELLSNGTVERICDRIKQAGIPYGFGGIARIGAGAVPAERIILEHYRLGSSRAILSRAFCDYSQIASREEIESIFFEEMHAIRAFEKYAETANAEVYRKNQLELKNAVKSVVQRIKKVI